MKSLYKVRYDSGSERYVITDYRSAEIAASIAKYDYDVEVVAIEYVGEALSRDDS